jgi:nitrogenase molybdenum-iron protein NifN
MKTESNITERSLATNPLKMSAPLGAAMAFMGVNRSMPLFHGSQGCTAFGLVLLVRHYREPIPLQTTAINEVTAIMGGAESLEQAILNIHKRTDPEFIGIATTALTETRSEDFAGDLRLFRERHPELDHLAIALVSTPDYAGSFQTGWERGVTGVIRQVAEGGKQRSGVVNLLPGSHMTPADVDEIKEIVASFGLEANVFPDISESLFGNQYDEYIATTSGGTQVSTIRELGCAEITVAFGEQMRPSAEALRERFGTPYELFDSLLGLEENDALLGFLSRFSGRSVPEKQRKWRARLVDLMLDAHFYFGGKRIAIAAEPDLAAEYALFMKNMGAEVVCTVVPEATAATSRLDFCDVVVGDLNDLELRSHGADLLLTHSHGRQASERLGVPLYRIGFPIFDRIGTAHNLHAGYRGSCLNVVNIGNILMEYKHGVGI